MFEIQEVIGASLDLFSSEEPAAVDKPIVRKIEIEKGTNTGENFILHVDWNYNPKKFNAVVAALLLDNNRTLIGLVKDDDCMPGIRSLVKSGGQMDFLFKVEPKELDGRVETIRFIAAVGSSRLYGGTFLDVESPKVRVIDGDSYKVKESFSIAEIHRRSTAIALGDYKKGKGFSPIGKGYNYSLADYVLMYGGPLDGSF